MELYTKRKLLISAILITLITFAAGCGSADNDIISVLSREEGSGTRGAFAEILKIQKENENGKTFDIITDYAEITNSTAVMAATVKGNKNAVGYISIGALNDSVKALAVDGINADFMNVKNGSYKISRAFNIITGSNIPDTAEDFISFIKSGQGQRVVEQSKYISYYEGLEYNPDKRSGKITVAGSSSVTPVIEKLKEAYIELNPNVTIDIQQSDSTTGISSTAEGLCHIGLSSRELSEGEKEQGLNSTVIALDGIAVIVNKSNSLNNITTHQIADIYTGKITRWREITE